MRKQLTVVAGLMLTCGPAIAQSRPADFISVNVTSFRQSSGNAKFARIQFEATNKSEVTFSNVLLTCSAYDAGQKLMGSSPAMVSNLGPGTAPGAGLINVTPRRGDEVATARCRVEMVMP